MEESDIFCRDDSDDEATIAKMDFVRMEQNLSKNGFREGVAAGQEKWLQDGFNEGFKTLASVAFKLGQLRGILTALIGQQLCGELKIPGKLGEQLQSLLDRTVALEEKCASEGAEPDNIFTTENTSQEKQVATPTNIMTEDSDSIKQSSCTGEKHSDCGSKDGGGGCCRSREENEVACCQQTISSAYSKQSCDESVDSMRSKQLQKLQQDYMAEMSSIQTEMKQLFPQHDCLHWIQI